MQEKLMILDFRQPANNPHEKVVAPRAEFLAKELAAALPVGESSSIKSKRDHYKLSGPANSERFVNLPPLLFTHNHDFVCYESRQGFLYRDEQPRFERAIVA